MSNESLEKHWSRLLPALSLDVSASFFNAMEIPIIDEKAFRISLRASMSTIMFAENTTVQPGLTTLKKLTDTLGQTTSVPFLKWGQAAFLGNHPDQPEWSAWASLCNDFAAKMRSGRSFLLPEEKQSVFIKLYGEQASTADIEKQQEDIAGKPLTDWDLKVFLQQQYGLSWESGPFSVTQSIIEIVRFKRFAAEFWPLLTPEERKTFYHGAQQWITENRVWMPGPLPTLDTLLRTQ